MVKELIREINYCLDNNCCMAALALALTLPDICGKALYPKSKPSERYVKWYDEHISKPENIEGNKLDINGDLIYSLRNSIIHEGNPNVNHNKFDVIYFELLYSAQKSSRSLSYRIEGRIVNDENGNEELKEKKISIGVRELCTKICAHAEECYNNNEKKFDFFNYRLVNADYRTREIFFK